jgi:hypothetical protein
MFGASDEMIERLCDAELEVERLRKTCDLWESKCREMESRKDAAYTERNRVVAVLARVCPSGIRKTDIEGWDDEWNQCVYIDMPCGQGSWHYTNEHAHLFANLPPYTKPYDGHTTEVKYARMEQMC